MTVGWAELEIPNTDFDIATLYSALDARRTERGMSWQAVAREINRTEERNPVHPISPATISGLKDKRWGIEGDGVLQMLLWLDRTPESFVPDHPGAMRPEARLARVPSGRILRFDVQLIFSKLDAQRSTRQLTWSEVAAEVGRFYTAQNLKDMSKQKRTTFPHVMRLARWLRCPVVALTRASYS
jgi:hypothetical protein